jgi:hypothetical protein
LSEVFSRQQQGELGRKREKNGGRARERFERE